MKSSRKIVKHKLLVDTIARAIENLQLHLDKKLLYCDVISSARSTLKNAWVVYEESVESRKIKADEAKELDEAFKSKYEELISRADAMLIKGRTVTFDGIEQTNMTTEEYEKRFVDFEDFEIATRGCCRPMYKSKNFYDNQN